jgi:hypothetical protein
MVLRRAEVGRGVDFSDETCCHLVREIVRSLQLLRINLYRHDVFTKSVQRRADRLRRKVLSLRIIRMPCNQKVVLATVIFNLCAHARKLTDFRLFYSDLTRKRCKIARNCHFALHYYTINFPFLNKKY